MYESGGASAPSEPSGEGGSEIGPTSGAPPRPASVPRAEARPPGYPPTMGHWVVAFLVQLAVSALVLMLAVAWVTPKNPRKTAGRAALVSLVLSAASTLTLARFAWFLLFPLLLYALVWVVVVTVAYKVTVARAALFALALSFISWAVAFGIPT